MYNTYNIVYVYMCIVFLNVTLCVYMYVLCIIHTTLCMYINMCIVFLNVTQNSNFYPEL